MHPCADHGMHKIFKLLDYPMLAIENLNKSFGKKTAVTDISISVPEPTMIGIIGSSGAGAGRLIRTSLYKDSDTVH